MSGSATTVSAMSRQIWVVRRRSNVSRTPVVPELEIPKARRLSTANNPFDIAQPKVVKTSSCEIANLCVNSRRDGDHNDQPIPYG